MAEELKDCASEFLGGVEWSAPVAAAIIHADRIATARHVMLKTAWELNETAKLAIGIDSVGAKAFLACAQVVRDRANNPTALAALLKETK